MKSKKNILFLLFCVLAYFFSTAQRYKTTQFQSLQIDSMTYATMDGKELKLDLIQPKNDSLKTARPLLIFMHGGSFKAGIRNKEDVLNYCKAWAKRGYVVATISYRLTLKGKSFHCDLPKEEKIKTFQNAVLDLHHATRYLLDRKEELNIDPNLVILSGNSAGAEAVLQGAFFRKDQLLEAVLPNNFSYAAAISHAGAMTDTALINKNTLIPLAVLHGTCDQWVPYASGYHHYCAENTPGALLLHGALSIKSRVENLDGSYFLYSECGGNHEVNKTSLISQLNNVVDFIYESVISKQKVQRELVDKSLQKNCRFGNYEFCN